MHDDVGSPVGKGVRIIDFGNAPDRAGLDLRLAHAFGAEHDAESRITIDAVREQLPITWFEDVQRKRRAGEPHQWQREKRQEGEGHPGKVKHRVARRTPSCPCQDARGLASVLVVSYCRDYEFE